jgi:hypothetical protein
MSCNATKTVATEKQSLHILQTCVAATISSIFWLRDLLPENCFETRIYTINDPEFGYKVNSDVTRTVRQKDKDDYIAWEFLLRGKHDHADKILSWLVSFHSPFLICCSIYLRQIG